MEVVAPKCFIVPTMENLQGVSGMLSGMLFISGGKFMVISGAKYAVIATHEA